MFIKFLVCRYFFNKIYDIIYMYYIYIYNFIQKEASCPYLGKMAIPWGKMPTPGCVAYHGDQI